MTAQKNSLSAHWTQEPFSQVCLQHPAAKRFAEAFDLFPAPGESFQQYLSRLPEDFLEERALDRDSLATDLSAYISAQETAAPHFSFQSLTITGGCSKSGLPEDAITLYPGEIVCILGPTGSGKSRLLADIESLAQGDTCSGRQILVNGAAPDLTLRYGARGAFAAELSQQMHFLLDETVEAFLHLHIRSRTADPSLFHTILDAANALSGEPFTPDTPLSALSGGQTRALMIADTALLGQAPILLIDELENAGINRAQALRFLLDQGKLVFLSTHDPVLSLLGQRRLVLSEGRIHKVICRTSQEEGNLPVLHAVDDFLMSLRERLRMGETLEEPLDAALRSIIKR